MYKLLGALVLCAASTAGAQSKQETFVVHAGQSGQVATITIPVGAVCNFSADSAEALVDYVDPRVEAMRLTGDVMIRVKGASQPIQIEADRVVLELTADQAPNRGQRAAPIRRLRSAEVIVGGDDTQTFAGNVSFTLQTSSGTMRIRADRVEHRGGTGAVSGL